MSHSDLLMLAYKEPSHTILDLPDELIEHVLLSIDNLNFRDVGALAVTCKRMADVISRSGAVWKTIFSTSFPEISRKIEKHVEKMAESPHLQHHQLWREFYLLRFKAGKVVRREIEKLSPEYYFLGDLSNVHMDPFVLLANQFDFPYVDTSKAYRKHGSLFIMDGLQSIITGPNSDSDLTARYYAKKVLRYLRCHFLEAKWIEFKSRPVTKQYFHEGLVYFSQWFQSDETIHLFKVISDIETIATDSLSTLQTRTPDHMIFQMTDQKAQNFADCLLNQEIVLTESIFHGTQALQILDALNDTLYEEKGFRGNSSNYYNPNNSYIDQVLARRQGIPITLCMLYSMVAARLGVLCSPVNAPNHFLLLWKKIEMDKVFTGAPKAAESVFIDCFNQGKRLTAPELEELVGHSNVSWFKVATPIEVFLRMARNLVNSAQLQLHETLNLHSLAFPLMKLSLELIRCIGSKADNPRVELCHYYLQMNINHREILRDLNSQKNLDDGQFNVQSSIFSKLCWNQMRENAKEIEEMKLIQPKYWSTLKDGRGKIKLDEMGFFCSGMVVKHKRKNYTCVITGWDHTYKETTRYEIDMGRLQRKENQPFYKVLVDDGTVKYLADEVLEPIKPVRINNPLVGKYFSHFHETYGYEPNDQLSFFFPEDFHQLISFKRKTSESEPQP